ncbi:thioesterase-like superfamily-domain-containing protein [Tricladium varicosporioides]|nr:thioesterase-like superfamily-domain-containing protein [Hymenoscyphus varicosporioides]
MLHSSGQTSLREALELRRLEPGSYTIETPPSLCFATVTIGGLVTSIIHKAAADFLSKPAMTNTHRDVLCVYTQFFRPTLPSPKQATLKFRVANSSKASTALHLEVIQNDKLCLAGYITMTNLAAPGRISMQTGWQLTPSPLPVSLKGLEGDAPSIWSGYLTPFDPSTYRKPHSYVRFYVPIERRSQYYIDQWVTPGWKDDCSPNGAVWTNETIHFIIDNSLPILNDLLDTDKKFDTYNKIVKAGLLQRQARSEGKDDRLWGEGLTDSELLFPWIISTVSTSTEVKRLLPNEGCKWLFMRNTVKNITDSRMDLEIVLMSEKMELVALSQHICQVIHVDRKRAKKASL